MAGQSGAAVVVEVDSGRLLASYRLEVAAQTLASPGSTLKPFTLAALLEGGKVAPETALVCRRRVRIGGQSLDCTHVQTVEPIDPVTALAYSCNYFFAHQARRLDVRELAEALRRAGLASPSGLAEGEATGAVRVATNEEEKQLEAMGHSGVETTPPTVFLPKSVPCGPRRTSTDSTSSVLTTLPVRRGMYTPSMYRPTPGSTLLRPSSWPTPRM